MPLFNLPVFLAELENTVINNCLPIAEKIVVLGDTNVNFLDVASDSVKLYCDALDVLGLHQMVDLSTRLMSITQSLIDHIIVSGNSDVSDVNVISVDISDHNLVFCRITVETISTAPFLKTYRNFRQFDKHLFQDDLQNSHLDRIYYTRNIDMKVKILNDTITHLFDIHAPVVTKLISKPPSP